MKHLWRASARQGCLIGAGLGQVSRRDGNCRPRQFQAVTANARPPIRWFKIISSQDPTGTESQWEPPHVALKAADSVPETACEGHRGPGPRTLRVRQRTEASDSHVWARVPTRRPKTREQDRDGVGLGGTVNRAGRPRGHVFAARTSKRVRSSADHAAYSPKSKERPWREAGPAGPPYGGAWTRPQPRGQTAGGRACGDGDRDGRVTVRPHPRVWGAAASSPGARRAASAPPGALPCSSWWWSPRRSCNRPRDANDCGRT